MSRSGVCRAERRVGQQGAHARRTADGRQGARGQAARYDRTERDVEEVDRAARRSPTVKERHEKLRSDVDARSTTSTTCSRRMPRSSSAATSRTATSDALGQFKDDIDRLINAIAYLEENVVPIEPAEPVDSPPST